MKINQTKEKQYQFMVEMQEAKGPVPMSIRGSVMWRIDPKLLLFTLSRHKFVAKMLSGYQRVLEVGCGDAFASRLIHPEVKELHSLDFDHCLWRMPSVVLSPNGQSLLRCTTFFLPHI